MKQPHQLLTWCGRDVSELSRDELEAALREACAYYENRLADAQRSFSLMREVVKRTAA